MLRKIYIRITVGTQLETIKSIISLLEGEIIGCSQIFYSSFHCFLMISVRSDYINMIGSAEIQQMNLGDILGNSMYHLIVSYVYPGV